MQRCSHIERLGHHGDDSSSRLRELARESPLFHPGGNRRLAGKRDHRHQSSFSREGGLPRYARRGRHDDGRNGPDDFQPRARRLAVHRAVRTALHGLDLPIALLLRVAGERQCSDLLSGPFVAGSAPVNLTASRVEVEERVDRPSLDLPCLLARDALRLETLGPGALDRLCPTLSNHRDLLLDHGRLSTFRAETEQTLTREGTVI